METSVAITHLLSPITIALVSQADTRSTSLRSYSNYVYYSGSGHLGPRVMFWCGKVNQHVDLQTDTWVTDPDGVSGCLRGDTAITYYCQERHPGLKITGVRKAGNRATICTWCDRGNTNCYHKSTKVNYHCVGKSVRYMCNSNMCIGPKI